MILRLDVRPNVTEKILSACQQDADHPIGVSFYARSNNGLAILRSVLRRLTDALSLPKFFAGKKCLFDRETGAPLSPKDFNNIAQGRESAPWVVLKNRTRTLKGFNRQ